MRGLRVAFQLIFGPPVVMLAAVGAAGAVGAQWGRTDQKLDLLAHFAPVWLGAAAVALAVSLLFRGPTRWATVGLSLVAMAGAGLLIAPEFLRSTGPHAPANAPGQLKIVQFNVWAENPNPEAILRWLDQENPDIAVIEEDSPQFMAALARHSGWRVACRGCEVLMLSRKAALFAAPPHDRRGREEVTPLTHGWFEDGQGVFEVIGVHNAWPTDADQPLQEARLSETIAQASRPSRVIVVGDFNSTPWSFARRYWDKAFGIPRRDRAIATWPARRYGHQRLPILPVLAIDHAYAGPAWATVSVRRGPRLTSDHYPLVITLAPVAPR